MSNLEIKEITTNTEFWIFESGGINVPYFFEGQAWAFVFYPDWNVLLKYKNQTWWHNNDKKSVSISSLQEFQKSLSQLGILWKINYQYVKTIYNYHYKKQECIWNSQLDACKLKKEVIYADKKIARLNYEWKTMIIEKLQKGILVKWWGSSDTIYFQNKNDLNKRLGSWLDQEVWTYRKRMWNSFWNIWKILLLKKSIWKKEVSYNSIETQSESEILMFEEWWYDLTKEPLTYLLVRNFNTWWYYCLSFVQETFDMMLGYWEAKKHWLYSNKHAENLDFLWVNSKVDVYRRNFPRLKPWMILRMSNTMRNMTHIWIVLPNNKIGHIIWDTFYVDNNINNISEWWDVEQVIVAKNKHLKEINSRKTNTTYTRGLNLETIWYRLRNSSALKLKNDRQNQAYITETVYQLNRSKFTLKTWYWEQDSIMILKRNSKLIIPKWWYK